MDDDRRIRGAVRAARRRDTRPPITEAEIDEVVDALYRGEIRFAPDGTELEP